MRKLFILLVALVAATQIMATTLVPPTWKDSATGISWTYWESNGEATLTGCYNSSHSPISGNIVLPSKVKKTTVTGIERGFAYNTGGFIGMASVTIPDSVTDIGDGAFKGLRGLTNVTMGAGVTNIGARAFADCTGLTRIAMSSGVISIGEMAFYGCTSLKNISIPDSVTRIGRAAFGCCDDSIYDIMTFPGAVLVDGWIVGPFADYKSTGSNEIGLLPEHLSFTGVRGIVDFAFLGRGNSKIVTLPNCVKRVGAWALGRNSNLTRVMISDGVKDIGVAAFSCCYNLTSIEVSDGNANYKSENGCLLTKDGKVLVAVPAGLDNVRIPKGVTVIGDCAFLGCHKISHLKIPDGVKEIGDRAFCGCRGLETITLPDSIERIGFHALSSLKITSLTMHRNVTRIGKCAFWRCEHLKSVEFKGNAPTCHESSFRNCPDNCEAYVSRESTGWGVEEGEKWNGLTIRYHK
ncbi:MAG: leucine-rich repeat domain-containing protein [Kiritimatiellae bacterium]|nr:leucine-rich repeat domain-containing protein [Kiritimatiellia bacterium]